MRPAASREPELVNPVPGEELPGWTRAKATAFLAEPDGAETRWQIGDLQTRWAPERAWGMRVGAEWVATLRTESRRLSVPAGPEQATFIAADALTSVTVSATHRRRGLMTRMLHASLRAARDRGDPVSVLIAAEWPIYSRFGYAPATLSADYVLHTRRPGAQCPGDPSRVRPVERDEFGRLAPEVFAQSGRRRAGQVNRDSGWWERNLGLGGREPREGLPHNWLVHESGNGPDGLLAWKATGHPSLIAPRQVIEVWLLADASEEAYRNLWSYLSGVDGVEQVKLPNRCVYEPVRWMLGDARSLVLSELVDFLWLRILDVPAALSARRYAVEDEFVLEVSDEAAGRFAAGRYRLSAGPDGAKCTATDAPADLEISQRTLASIYLGGFRLRELSPLGGVSEHTAGALDRLDLMFTTPLPPWNPTWF